ncbi:sulfurtransferase [Leptolyngbya sp. AN02str]|uniref:sulfurtransferase n=1 Tax=Leptolyngbya sp. AN02str TaxID=3423363 RepID=UPI003D31CC80
MAELALHSPILSIDELRGYLGHPGVAIADCRFSLADPALGYQKYHAGHIPGAVYFDLNRDLSSPVEVHGGRHPLPDPHELAKKLAAAGISNGTWVVAYDDARFGFAARFWWLLRYMGHTQVALLDGGFGAWQAAGCPVTSEPSTPQPGTFIPQVQSHMVVDIEQVRSRKDLPGVVLVDSREAERYLGQREPIDPVAGHILGAVNYPWQQVTDDAGRVRSPEAQQQRWATVKDASELIVYCGSGVTACVNLLSLELAGVSNTKLYPGSWSDWCSYL